MLYTEGNLRAEDIAFRRIARSKVLAALRSAETKWTTLLDSLVAKLGAQDARNLTVDHLINFVERHPQLQPEAATIERYTNAFPELADAVSSTHERLRTRSRRRLERALASFEYRRRFQFTKGLSH